MNDFKQRLEDDFQLRPFIEGKYNLTPNDPRYIDLINAWYDEAIIKDAMPMDYKFARNYFIGWCKYEVNRKNAFKNGEGTKQLTKEKPTWEILRSKGKKP